MRHIYVWFKISASMCFFLYFNRSRPTAAVVLTFRLTGISFWVILNTKSLEAVMRTRKPTHGKVSGIKFGLSENKEENDLKKVKEKMLKDLEEQEKNKKEWFDKEIEKNMKK